MAATTILASNNATTFLAASITAAATTAALSPGTGSLFPNPGANQAFPITFVDALTGLVNEIAKVTAMSGDTIVSMVRGQEGTSARAWLAGDLANNFMTAGALGFGALAQAPVQQAGQYNYAVDTGSANAIVIALSPAITTYTDGMPLVFKAAANNTGATMINAGAGAIALQGDVGALQGGEIVAGKIYVAYYNSTGGVATLAAQTGGAQQGAPATQSEHFLQLQQAQGMRMQYTGQSGPSTTQTLTTAIAGESVIWAGATGTLTLPDVSTMPAGVDATTFTNCGTGPVTIACFAGQVISGVLGSGALASIVLQVGDDLVITTRSTTTWRTVSGSALRQFAPLVIAPAVAANQAMQLGQVAVFGAVRNLKASLATAGTTLTFAADAIIVKSVLNGISTLLTSYSQALSLAAGTGAGKMDTGTAPVSGYVAVYATWGPTVGAGTVGQNATSSVAPEQYGGAFLPAGVTETQLISVWPTNSSGQFVIGCQVDRAIGVPQTFVLSTAIAQASPAALVISTIVPMNARIASGQLVISSTASSNASINVMSTSNSVQVGLSGIGGTVTAAPIYSHFSGLQLQTPQTLFYTCSSSAGTPSFQIAITDYTF